MPPKLQTPKRSKNTKETQESYKKIAPFLENEKRKT